MRRYCLIAELQRVLFKEFDMKEFEKWYEEIYPKYPPGINPNNFVFHAAVCGGWKAALAWVLDNFDGKTDILTLGLNIRDELEE